MTSVSATVKKSAAKKEATSPRQSPRRKKVDAAVVASVPAPSTLTASSSKQAIVVDLLKRPIGATLAELMTTTGWQAHSVRGVISGVLRKRLKYVIELETGDNGVRRYRIVAGGTA